MEQSSFLPRIKRLHAKGRTSSVQLRDGEIILRLPVFLSEKERLHTEELLLQKIIPKLSARTTEQFLLQEIVRKSLALFVGGHMVHLSVSWGAKDAVKMQEGQIMFKFSSIPTHVREEPTVAYGEQISMEKLAKVLLQYARRYLQGFVTDILLEWVEYLQAPKPKEILIKHVQTRWGSCSRLKIIVLSLKTLLLPDELFEYVCVHEVAHLFEMNHSAKFWAHVERAKPNWKALRQEMNTYT